MEKLWRNDLHWRRSFEIQALQRRASVMLGRFREHLSNGLCESLVFRSSRGLSISRDLARESNLLDRGGRRHPRSEKLDENQSSKADGKHSGCRWRYALSGVMVRQS